VRKLAAELQSYDIRVWLDEAEIKIGDSLIEKKPATCRRDVTAG
jgi:hypothetical protein